MGFAPSSGAPPHVRSLGGRYLLLGEIASGGMAAVHYGKLLGANGFARNVAIKRMLKEFSSNPDARAMLIDEARLASRVNHVNVVQTLDVVEEGDELFLVLEYVHGESLDRLLKSCRAKEQLAPPEVIASIMVGALRGLHAAHEAVDENGTPLELIHRDLSPHNIIVDTAGVSRVLDFGVAKARGRLQNTETGKVKGKFAYMAPEQMRATTSRSSDLFSMGIVLWECLAGRRLFTGENDGAVVAAVLACQVPDLQELVRTAPEALARVTHTALQYDPAKRYATALEMAQAIESTVPMASPSAVAAWVRAVAAGALAVRDEKVKELDATSADSLITANEHAVKSRRPRWPFALAAVAGALVTLAASRSWKSTLEPPPAPGSAGAMLPVVATQQKRPEPGALVAQPAADAGPLAVPLDAAPLAAANDMKHDASSGSNAKKLTLTSRKPVSTPPAAHDRNRSPPSARAAASPKCDVPYTVDEKGHRHYKAECF